MMRLVALTFALALPGCLPPPAPTGAEDFASFCSACHGAGGRGDGELAATLDRKPADLTGLSRRNKGVFPTTRVMAKIWGYTGAGAGTGPGHSLAIMPKFGPLLEGELMPYDGGDGIQTPTPLRLVQIAEYLKGLQN